MAIKILIDSGSDISDQEARDLGVTMLPMTVTFGNKEFMAGVDLSAEEFYKMLEESEVLPKTAQIPPHRFEEAFKRATGNGDQVITLIISSKLSGTYESARSAAKNFSGKVFVIDTMSVSTGERLICQYALSLIEKGLSAEKICEEIEKVKSRVRIYAVLETLEYLKKGGRISKTVALAGKILNIKPVVQLLDGEVKMAGKARGQKNGAAVMNNIIKNGRGIDLSMPFAALWTGLDKTVADEYVKNSSEIFKDAENVPSYLISCTIGTHVGPGAFGIAYFEKENK